MATVGNDRAAIGAYVHARLADATGETEIANRSYAELIDQRPDDVVLASRAYRQAMTTGDITLALRAAAPLDRAGVLPADGRLLLFVSALRVKDWPAAERITDRIASDGNFDFLVPMLRAWVAFGAKRGDPVAMLDAAPASALGGAYRPAQRILLQLALGRYDDAQLEARALAATGTAHAGELRLSAAATLAAQGRKDTALSLLDGDAPALVRARTMVAAGKAPVPPVIDARGGTAWLFARLAADIGARAPSPGAIAIGWLALALAPDDDATLLLVGRMLAAGDDDEWPGVDDAAALMLVERANPDGPFAAAREQIRVGLLMQADDKAAALNEALTLAGRPEATLADFARLGDIYTRLGRHGEAADAYGRAVALAGADSRASALMWSLYLLYGGALDRAGDWKRALPMLEKAVALAPQEAHALNYLGYSKLEKKQDIANATALVKRAAALKPDDPAIADSLGYAYYLGGDFPRAIQALERAVAGQPTDPTINEHLGDAYWKAGRRFEARYAWRAAMATADGDDHARLADKLERGLDLVQARR
ncbi:tetratricopeptide repeat protein [Sphingomonas flavalba]|uniref:tetratricopeptide repeat protein n=1 Tax=Sphingomonas flavalba TaxID=2559804 RepID=UPI0039E08B67